MADDTFTEVTTQSWFGRIGESIKGILFGLVLIAGAVILLFWNEGRAVKRAKTLSEGAKAVTTVSADRIDPANAGKLVHLIGMATTTETLADPEFGVSAAALKLRRIAEMYQWKESESSSTKKNLGGSTTTTKTYNYDKAWSASLISSSQFKHPEGHANPAAMPYQSHDIAAGNVTAGAFTLSASLVNRINNFTDLPFAALDKLPDALKENSKLADGRLFMGADPSSPQVGDHRVSFQVANPTVVSLVARQVKNSFEPYHSKAGGELELLQVGEFSASEMFRQAKETNRLLTWGLRLGGLILMWFGFGLVTRPLSVLADVVPFIGSIVAFGTGLLSLIMAAVVSLVTVAVAWFWYRPVLSVLLVGVAVVIIFMAYGRRGSSQLVT
jgi:hypothetical protein